jgi:hypothetical protein
MSLSFLSLALISRYSRSRLPRYLYLCLSLFVQTPNSVDHDCETLIEKWRENCYEANNNSGEAGLTNSSNQFLRLRQVPIPLDLRDSRVCPCQPLVSEPVAAASEGVLVARLRLVRQKRPSAARDERATRERPVQVSFPTLEVLGEEEETEEGSFRVRAQTFFRSSKMAWARQSLQPSRASLPALAIL